MAVSLAHCSVTADNSSRLEAAALILMLILCQYYRDYDGGGDAPMTRTAMPSGAAMRRNTECGAVPPALARVLQ